jgi:maltooligosyltrehalose trehalohydrolase
MIDYQPVRPTDVGVTCLPDGRWQFVVWAPQRHEMAVGLQAERNLFLPMERDELGYHRVVAEHGQVRAGSKYLYRLDGDAERQRPDPASRFQPEGVNGPSEVVDTSRFPWTDEDWKGVALEDSVFYEVHVGTFTEEGTFSAIIPQLDRLADLGVTTIELMPIAQFPGRRNWGYDGVFPFASQNTYGSPRDLQVLVDAAHARNLAVAVDVVYNHLGPEGNYLSEYGPYFTDHYHTPWGAALNFDGRHSDEVRFFFIQSARYWLENFHVDALRLDAIHSIVDASALPFLAELAAAVGALSERLQRKIYLVAESDLNDARTTSAIRCGGIGMDAQWSDDFHHSVHTLLTGEKLGYYADFGNIHHLASTLKNGWYYSGQYSHARQRKHGNAAPSSKGCRFVVCSQNHDQVGNRVLGERLSSLVNFESLKLAAAVTLLSPFVPLLFMGEEYGETSPFLYFTSHDDPQLAEAVRRGRAAEFAHFRWKAEVPDPQDRSTFATSKLNHSLSEREPHRTLQRFYKALLQFRRDQRWMEDAQFAVTEYESDRAVLILRATGHSLFAALFHFGDTPATIIIQLPAGTWKTKIDSAAPEWLGHDAGWPQLDISGLARIRMAGRAFTLLERSNPLME